MNAKHLTLGQENVTKAPLDRATGDEFLGDKGIAQEIFVREIVPGLIRAGIDCIDVSAGCFETFENIVQPLYFPRAFLVPLAEAAKEVSTVPVVGVGRINDPRLAEKLVEDGKVDMVALCRALIDAPYMDIMRMPVLPRYIQEEKVSLLTGVEVVEIEDRRVRYRDKEGKEGEVGVDTVILATGRRPNRELVDGLRGKVPELYPVGDCVEPRRIFAAIHDGSYFAREL